MSIDVVCDKFKILGTYKIDENDKNIISFEPI